MTTRTAALFYLPTLGLLSVARAISYYHHNPKG